MEVAMAEKAILACLNGISLGGIQVLPGGYGMYDKQIVLNKLSIPDQGVHSDINELSATSAKAVEAIVGEVEDTYYAKDKQILLNKIGDLIPNIVEVNQPGGLTVNITLDGASILNLIESFSIRYSQTAIHNSIDIASSSEDLFQSANPINNYGSNRITVVVGTRTMYFLVERVDGDEESFTIFGRSISAMDDAPYSAKVEIDLDAPQSVSSIANDVMNYNSVIWNATNWSLPKNYSFEGSPIEHLMNMAQIVRAVVRCQDDGSLVVRNAFTTRPIHMLNAAADVSYDRVDDLLAADFSIDLGTNEGEVSVDGYGSTLQLPTIEVEEREDNTQGVDVFIRIYWVNEVPRILDDLVTDGVLVSEGTKSESIVDEIITFENGKGDAKYPIYSLGSVKWLGSMTAGSLSYKQYSSTITGNDGAFAVAKISYTTQYRRYKAGSHDVEAILAAAFIDENVGISVKVKFGDGNNEAAGITDGNLTSIEAAKQRGIAYLDANKYDQKLLSIEVPYDDDALDGNIAYINDAKILCSGNFAIINSEISVEGPKVVNKLGLKQCQIS